MLTHLLVSFLLAGAGPATTVRVDSAASLFEVSGLRVIHQSRSGTHGVVARLYLLGGARQLTSSTAGVEALLLRAAQLGSAAFPAAAGTRALARTGASITVDAADDWATITLRTTREHLDSAWAVWADRIVHPTLAWEDVDHVRVQMLSELLADAGSPDGILRQFVRSVGFAGHPYANDPNGTDRSLRSLTPEVARRYHQEQFVKSRMLLVVVGDVDRAAVERLVSSSLSMLPAGAYTWTMPPALRPRETSMSIIPRKLETDYIIGVFAGPLANAREYGGFRVATGLLGAHVNRVVREEEHLAYTAYAPIFDNGATAGAVYVSTTSPERVMDLLLKQVETVANDGLPTSAIPWFVSQYSIESLMEQETNAGRAEAMARGYLLFNDYTAVDAPLKAMSGFGEDRVKNMAARFMPGIQFIFVGDTSRFHKFMR